MKTKEPGIDFYKTHLLEFIHDFFPEYSQLEDFQLDIIKLLDDFFKQGIEGQKNNTKHKTLLQICVTAGKGVGKTILIALISLWSLVCFPNLSCNYYSGTRNQSVEVFFRNCARILTKSRIKRMFKVSTMKINLVADDGRPILERRIDCIIVNKDNLDCVAGSHSEVNFCFYDEAATQTIEAFNTTAGVITGGLTVLFVSGNTTRKDTLLYYIWTLEDKNWNKFNISGYQMSRNSYNIEALEQVYGVRGTKLNDIYVCGKFNEDVDGLFLNAGDIENLLPRGGEDVKENINSYLEHLYQGMPQDYVIGIDVSNGIGGDFTSVIMRCNNYAKLILYTRDMNINNLAGFLNRIYVQGYTRFALDCCGVGMALSSLLKPYGITPLKIFSQMKPHDKLMYSDYRSELACSFREQLREGGLQLDLGEYKTRYSRDIWLQFTNIPFEFNKSQMKVANKSNMANSPDVFDSLIYTFVGGIKTSNIDLKSGIRDYRLDSRGKLINRNRGNYW